MMKPAKSVVLRLATLFFVLFLTACAGAQAISDPLPSWTNGDSKQRIVDFVTRVTDSSRASFVPANERVATFDNDGTLWSEKPTYFQLLFILERVKVMADDHPEWSQTQPFKAVIEDDWATLGAAGAEGLAALAVATQTGITTQKFQSIVQDWAENSRHPVTGKLYTEMVFQPMLELIDYLKANDFKVFIVSGGGLEFIRPWTDSVYGIPPHQVVGSSFETRYELRDGEPVLVQESKMHFLNRKDDKPVAINRFIGQRPILAAGNSDSDFEMLEWTTAGDGERLGLLVHHTDAKREWAYDRESSEGRLSRGLDEADKKDWLLIDMARDWLVIYPADTEE
jgi:phosphoserine phosphatase